MPESLAMIVRSTQDTFEVSATAWAAALGALDDRDEIARRLDENRRVGAAMEAELSALGVDFRPSHTNFIHTRPRDPAVFTAAMAAEGVIVRITGAFGDPTRVRVGIPAERDLDRVIAALRLAAAS